jgi:hypothetical protein
MFSIARAYALTNSALAVSATAQAARQFMTSIRSRGCCSVPFDSLKKQSNEIKRTRQARCIPQVTGLGIAVCAAPIGAESRRSADLH